MRPKLEAEELKESNAVLLEILREKIAARAAGVRISKEDIDEINAYCNMNKNLRENAKFALAKTLAAPELARIIDDAKPRRLTASNREWNGAAPQLAKRKQAAQKPAQRTATATETRQIESNRT